MAQSSTQQAREGRSHSPDLSLLPSLETLSPLPITHLHGIQSYLADWGVNCRHARQTGSSTCASMAEEGRRLSTGIPRPSPGTSRTSKSRERHAVSCLTPLLSPARARRPSQLGSSDITSDDSSPAYHLPRSLLPRSESLFTDFETNRHFKRALYSPRAFFHRLPKSQTTPTLTSPSKDIASHSLLRPLGPPLPASQTFSDLSALQSLSNSPNKVPAEVNKIHVDDIIVPKAPAAQLRQAKSSYPQLSADQTRPTPQVCGNSSVVQAYTDATSASTVSEIAPSDHDPRFVSP